MNSIRNLSAVPAGRALTADDIVEFHAARLLLLVYMCGAKSKIDGLAKIDGLTKLAKLDFFVRYPGFFAEACRKLNQPVHQGEAITEALMVRHHYGPWDKRYYQVLAFLEGTKLITILPQSNRSFRFSLTQKGLSRADALRHSASFAPLVEHMRSVKRVFGGKSGDALKKLIYELFDDQVARRVLGEVIRDA